MPNQIPDFQISNFLATNTNPLRLDELTTAGADTACPICHHRYVDPPQNYVHPNLPEDEEEYAIQIQNRGECKHTFGRRCIEHHIRGGNPWSHTCPLCRTEWFPAPNAGRRELLGDVDRALNHMAALDVEHVQVRAELRQVEDALERIRETLYGYRWI